MCCFIPPWDAVGLLFLLFLSFLAMTKGLLRFKQTHFDRKKNNVVYYLVYY